MSVGIKAAIKASAGIDLLNKQKGTKTKWEMYPEQKRILEQMLNPNNKRIIILKIRQIGVTWLSCYRAVLHCLTNPDSPVAVMAHNDPTSVQIVENIKEIATQFGMTLVKDSAHKIVFSNGAKVESYTAGAKNGPRGKTYGLIIASEAAYYSAEDIMASLGPVITQNGQIIMESTATAAQTAFRQIWHNEEDDTWVRIFTGFESHPAYVKDADLIDDKDWEFMSNEYGFTSRPHAAWWAMEAKTQHDLPSMLREYPIDEDQAWAAATGRWVSIDPVVRPYTKHPDNFLIHIYEEPQPRKVYVASMDTGTGTGGDRTVIIVVDCETEEIVASYTDNNTPASQVIKGPYTLLLNKYNFSHCIIESNGAGNSSIDTARDMGYKFRALVANRETKMKGLSWAKHKIEAGMAADEELLKDCQSCIVLTNDNGKVTWKNRKDFLSAIGFLGCYHKDWSKLTYKDVRPKPLPNQFDMEKQLSKAIRINKRETRRNPWTG